MPRGAWVGVIYWLCFLTLVIWALSHDFREPSPVLTDQHYSVPHSEYEQKYDKNKNRESIWKGLTNDPVAFATLIVAIATAILAFSTIGLWRVTNRSVDIAERALTEVERPYVFVFNPHWSTSDGPIELLPNPLVLYTVANYGKTPAIIDDAMMTIVANTSIPRNVEREHAGYSLFTSPIMQGGEIRNLAKFPTDFLYFRGIKEIAIKIDGMYKIPVLAAGESLFFRAIITYHGAFSGNHESAFCWRYDDSSGVQTFIQEGGNEYNYIK